MATADLTDQDAAHTIAGNDIVFVNFWAYGCGPCGRLARLDEAASTQDRDVVVAEVDTEAEADQALAGALAA